MKPVSRSSGRSAVAAAAYRAGADLFDERAGQAHDYSRKEGVELSEIVLPEGMEADWAQDRETLWNAAEAAERRRDARVAREFEVALPEEVAAPEREDLAISFAEHLADRYGTAVDIAVHAPSRDGDGRNHHAHLLMTVREIRADGFGGKAEIEWENRRLKAEGLPVAQEQLRTIRRDWERLANGSLAAAGHDVRVDCRSHSDRGLHVLPSEHVGVHATQMARSGMEVARARLDAEALRINADAVRERPEDLLALLTAERSVFTAEDVRRALWRCSARTDGASGLAKAVLESPAVVEVPAEPAGMAREARPARYTTREMLDIEQGMLDRALRMAARGGFAAPERALEDGLRRLERGGMHRIAAEHLAGDAQVAAVTGLAGGDRPTMLAAARAAWEAADRRVLGAALSDRAAEVLERASGIASRALLSVERGWDAGDGGPARGDVLVIDRADMLGIRQMARVVTEADEAGAKLVLAGEAGRLRDTGPGAGFRAIAGRIGAVDLECIRSQREPWQREASAAFATWRTGEALAAYAGQGRVTLCQGAAEARQALAETFVTAGMHGSFPEQVALAHRQADVRELNGLIREEMRLRGALGGREREIELQTDDGPRGFVEGDRIRFPEGDRDLGVHGGDLGTVERLTPSDMTVRLDTERRVTVPAGVRRALDHGYAAAIREARDRTVDRAFVLASGTMDRHQACTAMTRHRHEATMFADGEAFPDIGALSARLSRSGLEAASPARAEARVADIPAPPDREADPLRRTAFERALIGYGRAAASILRHREQGLEPLQGHVKALNDAAARLEKARPGARDRLDAALRRDGTLREEVQDLKGKALSARLKDAVAAQERFERSPAGRLERFVERWNETVAEQEVLYEARKVGLRDVRRALKGLSRELDRDGPAKALLVSGEARLASGREVPQEAVEGLLHTKLPESTERLRAERASRAQSRAAQRSMGAEIC